MISWKKLSSETEVENDYVTVKRNKVQLPDGAVIDDFYTLTIPDASLIVALTSENEILLKREYRYACLSEVIECPAGMVNQGEEPEQTAKRELLEETGYQSTDWTYLGSTWESTSKLTNTMHLFVARNCVRISTQHLDENEHIEVLKTTLEDAVKMVMDGQINANSSAHAILKVARILGV